MYIVFKNQNYAVSYKRKDITYDEKQMVPSGKFTMNAEFFKVDSGKLLI